MKKRKSKPLPGEMFYFSVGKIQKPKWIKNYDGDVIELYLADKVSHHVGEGSADSHLLAHEVGIQLDSGSIGEHFDTDDGVSWWGCNDLETFRKNLLVQGLTELDHPDGGIMNKNFYE